MNWRDYGGCSIIEEDSARITFKMCCFILGAIAGRVLYKYYDSRKRVKRVSIMRGLLVSSGKPLAT